MKKHYIRLTVVIEALILVVFILAGVLFTVVTANKTMNEYMDQSSSNGVLRNYKSDDTIDSVIQKTYSNWQEQNIFYPKSDIGFSQVVFFQDGRKLESGDYLSVRNLEGSLRYIPIENGFDRFKNRDLFYIMSEDIDGKCDSNFIYDVTFKKIVCADNFEPFSCQFGKNDFVSDSDAVSVSEWANGSEIEAQLFRFAETDAQEKLNREAKDLLYRMVNENPVFQSKKNLFTSYCVKYDFISSISVVSYQVYLYHPLLITLQNHMAVYILSAIILLIMEVLVIFIMKKLYSNRMCYELMRQDLTRGIAHDLKTPLAVTKAYTENWEYIDEENRPEYSEKINQEVDQMSSLISQMLSVSKLDSDTKLNTEEIELNAMVSAVVNQMQPIIQERELEVRIVTDQIDGEYLINADPKMMRIVISNFISNAVKYAEKIVTVKLLKDSKTIMFMIENDGEGISKKDIRKIWEPFYRGDKARTDRLSSSGMGLAINKSILNLHKAKYKCTSEQCRTIFWFKMRKVK